MRCRSRWSAAIDQRSIRSAATASLSHHAPWLAVHACSAYVFLYGRVNPHRARRLRCFRVPALTRARACAPVISNISFTWRSLSIALLHGCLSYALASTSSLLLGHGARTQPGGTHTLARTRILARRAMHHPHSTRILGMQSTHGCGVLCVFSRDLANALAAYDTLSHSLAQACARAYAAFLCDHV